jgi:mannose-1-phosphate guanylyltransferase
MAEVFDELMKEGVTSEALASTYSQCKSISIDYAILEKADNVFVCLGDFNWSDLGSWNSIHETSNKDEHQNVIDANAITYDTENSIIKGPKDKLMIVEGLDGYLVAEFDNVLIVCKKDNEEQFRKFVSDVRIRPNADKFL